MIDWKYVVRCPAGILYGPFDRMKDAVEFMRLHSRRIEDTVPAIERMWQKWRDSEDERVMLDIELKIEEMVSFEIGRDPTIGCDIDPDELFEEAEHIIGIMRIPPCTEATRGSLGGMEGSVSCTLTWGHGGDHKWGNTE